MEKILCPSILNLPVDRLKDEILALDQADIDILHVDMKALQRTCCAAISSIS